MRRRQPPIRRDATLALCSLLTLAAVSTVALPSALGRTRNEERSRVIAITNANGFRVVLTATRLDRSSAPAATVRIAASERIQGAWHQLGRALSVGRRGGWFWKVVTGPHSLRAFSVSTNGSEPISLRLLLSPSLGWSQRFQYHVETGVLVRG